MTDIGLRIRALREQNGLTLEEVGRHIGVNKATVSRYESGAIPNIPIQAIAAIAKLFGVHPAEILGFSDPSVPSLTPDPQDVLEGLLSIRTMLIGDDDVVFDGDTLDEKTRRYLIKALEHMTEVAKILHYRTASPQSAAYPGHL